MPAIFQLPVMNERKQSDIGFKTNYAELPFYFSGFTQLLSQHND
jgi:hypothetical protein